MLSPLFVAAMLAQGPGQIAPDVRCAKDPQQGYALYLPSNYTPDRAWPLLLAFDPRARGMNAVERFAPAAEAYGWIIAGSNNSRNGSWTSSTDSLKAMSEDIFGKYPIDQKRVYAGGMSGGARVSTQIALGTGQIAGVIAASAGFPDGKARKTAPFVLFGTAGTDDFNWSEMTELDHTLTSPHRVVIFEGGHVWLSAELATEAIEWMELQAMRSGLRAKDPALIGKLFAKRASQTEARSGKAAWDAARGIAADFEGLREEATGFGERARKLQKDKAVQDAVKKERGEMIREQQLLRELFAGEAALADVAKHREALADLRDKLSPLAKQAQAEQDSSERRIARRVTRSIAASGAGAGRDPDYVKLLATLGLGGRPR